MSNPRPPISWTPCPHCGAKAHDRCVTKSGLVYGPGVFHNARRKAAGRPQ